VAQPSRYVITVDFSDEELNGVAGRSTVRTAMLDAQFADVAVSIDEICDNLALIQRDDGELLDGTVELHTLSSDVLALIASSAFTVRGGWVTVTDYAVGDMVLQAGVIYLCMVAHTSGTFATDLAAGNWGPITVTVIATGVTFSPTSTLDATNVQAAIVELDDEIRPSLSILNRQLFQGL
jgi:hypothetical protein